LLGDALNPGGLNFIYCHKIYRTDTVIIQVKVLSGYTVDLYYSANCWGAWTKLSSGTKEVDGSVYDYWEVSVAMSTFAAMDTVQFRMEILTIVPAHYQYWYSEPVELLTYAADDGLLKVEYFNIDAAFEVDYSTEITNLLRIEATLKDYKPGGEMSVFDNQNEVTKIKDEVKRILTFKTELIPAYLAEMLRVAVAHDKFFINEVEYTAEALPEFEVNSSNLGIFTVTLTQRNVIGLNTHDIGFNCDGTNTSDMIVLQELAASGSKSFAITDDYLVLTLTGQRVAGSPKIKAGTTPGGDDVLVDMSLSASYVTEVALIPTDKASISGGTLYVTISGTGATANINILTIKNRP
jgi:hypothetical protein